MFRGRGLAVLAAIIALAGCAGETKKTASTLEPAEASCKASIARKGSITRCDRYVEAATATGDKSDIAEAYLLRSFWREYSNDLPGAIADVDLAIAAWPEFTTSKQRRAQLMAEDGDYAGAREAFKRLEGIDDDPAFDETLALIEYVDGARDKAPPLFRTSATSYRDLDYDPEMAAHLDFYAAVVESELNDGSLAPIAALKADIAQRNKLLELVWRHRMREIGDAELLQAVQALGAPVQGALVCMPQFSIGHRNIIEGNRPAALEGFRRAAQECQVYDFEYHAAKAWLKQLGA
jgi:tetratricopeptide (TPR) repeat protein